jgi:hypothetical protein
VGNLKQKQREWRSLRIPLKALRSATGKQRKSVTDLIDRLLTEEDAEISTRERAEAKSEFSLFIYRAAVELEEGRWASSGRRSENAHRSWESEIEMHTEHTRSKVGE